MSQTSVRTWLLLAAGFIALLAFAAGSCGYGVVRSIRSSGAYQKAVEELRRHPVARDALGEPIAEGWLPTGSVNVTGPAGEAKLAIPVRGPKGGGTLYLEAVKRADEWEMTLLQLQPPTGARIDLLAGAEHRALVRGCEGGKATDCNALAVALAVGKGVESDPAGASRLFRKACDLHDPEACSNLGLAYANGWGVDKDLARAAALFEQACGEQFLPACVDLGALQLTGSGVAKDVVRAATFFKRGCDGHIARACSNLGVLYQRGLTVPKDLARAAALYKQGCDGGHPLGCTNLAELESRARK